MMVSKRLMLGSAVAALLVSTAVYAQGPDGFGGRRGMGGPGGFGRFGLGVGPEIAFGRLGLSDAQETQIREIRARNQSAAQATRTRLREAAEAQMRAVTSLPVDEGQIRAAAQTLADVQADAAVLMARVRSEIWAVLTPDQQARATAAMEQRRSRISERLNRMERRQQGRAR